MKQEEVKLSYSHLTCCQQFSGLPNVIVVEKKNQQIVQIATGKTSSRRDSADSAGSLAAQGSQAKAKSDARTAHLISSSSLKREKFAATAPLHMSCRKIEKRHQNE